LLKTATNRPQIILSDYGKIINKAVNNISQYYPQFNVDKYVIMPNHIHMILIIDMDDANGRLIIAPTTVSNVIKEMKSYVVSFLYIASHSINLRKVFITSSNSISAA